MNYKNIKTDEIISEVGFKTLPNDFRSDFVETTDEATHMVVDGSDQDEEIFYTVLLSEVIGDVDPEASFVQPLKGCGWGNDCCK